jgi:hypothetical protein
MSYRHADGVRRNKRTGSRIRSGAVKLHTKTRVDGTMETQVYIPPRIANPGNCINGIGVGGSRMGSRLCHENEAPFPEDLAKWFIRHLCPPEGIVLDPFSGSGTTVSSAIQIGRRGVGTDIRESQVQLGYRRIAEVQPMTLTG